MAKPVVISLNVQANSLFNLENPSQEQIDSLCSFSDDNNGNSPNGTVEDFTTTVYINNNVKWIGVSQNQGFKVAIDSINYKPNGNNVNCFDTPILQGSGGISGNVNANVKNDSSLQNRYNDYLIEFTVYESPHNFKSFSIDPKLLINV